MKPPAGVFISNHVLQVLHDYLMTRPCNETFDLVVALRQAKPVVRPPK